MNNLRFVRRFYSTPVNIYNFNKIKIKNKIVSKEVQKKYCSYKNMYNALKKQ